MSQNYIDNVRGIFSYYKELGEKAIDQISPNRINWYFHNDTNSVAILVKHMAGNMKSRFTDFLTTDGEKEWRHRDSEFQDDIQDKESMMQLWEEGWAVVFEALDSVDPNNLDRTVLIRSEPHTITEALNRQLAHYAYHVGQIVFLCKMLATKWESLSIPKGGSMAFNEEKMAH